MVMCDRCGTICKEDNKTKYILLRRLLKGDVNGAYPQWLCIECNKDLEEWMKVKKRQDDDV